MADQGFTDLRLNSSGSSTEHSIWPSFADMMSVIAMIFMLTMVVLVISNWDLVEQLQKALEVEQRLSAEAEESAKRNARLATSLSDKESKLSYLQMQIINLQNERDEQKNLLQLQGQQLAEVKQSLGDVKGQLLTQSSMNLEIGQQLKLSQKNLKKSQEELSSVKEAYLLSESKHKKISSQLALAHDQVTQLQGISQGKDQEVSRLTLQVEAMQGRINEFQDEQLKQASAYASLKKKYDRLVRPARSSKGKKVVEVSYLKQDKTAIIKLRKPGSSVSGIIDKNSLLAYLDKLKVRFPKKIYIKVVFPEGNFISHEEAWRFTSELLSKYDYYYQD